MGDEVSQYGLGPGRPTGHYNRHLKRKFKMHSDSPDHYSLQVPGHFKHDFSRTLHTLQVRPLHEIVNS